MSASQIGPWEACQQRRQDPGRLVSSECRTPGGLSAAQTGPGEACLQRRQDPERLVSSPDRSTTWPDSDLAEQYYVLSSFVGLSVAQTGQLEWISVSKACIFLIYICVYIYIYDIHVNIRSTPDQYIIFHRAIHI